MARYIDADMLKSRLIGLWKQLDYIHPKQAKGINMAICELDEAPAADVEEVRHGKWKSQPYMDDEYFTHFVCSECGRSIKVLHGDVEKLKEKYPYCHCGARMDDDEK